MAAAKNFWLPCLVVVAGCAQPLANRFSTIQADPVNGTPRSQVIDLLGVPTAIRAAAVAGIEAEWAEWRDRNSIYAIGFIQGRAAIKTIRTINTKEI